MTTQDHINNAINNIRLVKDRLIYLESNGVETAYIRAGSGGKGRTFTYKGKQVTQISYGISKWNYAYIAFL